jgi:hypothetical protein
MLAGYDAKRLININWLEDLNDFEIPFYNVFVSVLNVISGYKDSGEVLEETVKSWLIARLVAAAKVNMKSLSLETLLATGDDTQMIATPKLNTMYYEENKLPPIYKNVTKFATLFNEDVEVSDKDSRMIYKSVPRQNYDNSFESR